MTSKTILIDGDSIAYMAGIGETTDDVHRVVDEYMSRIKNRTWDGKYELFIEGLSSTKNIFRNHVAVTKPYKGSRKGKDAPLMLNYAKEYMVDQYGAQVQYYIESEDMVAIRAYEIGLEFVIIASIDKDMLQIPTQFYNYNKDEQFIMMEYQSSMHFWTQVLTGDSTDNIPGLYRVGPKKAEMIMLGIGTMHIDHIDGVLCRMVAQEYVDRDHNYQYFVEQCRLLRMLRSRTEVYLPPLSLEEYNKLHKKVDL